MSDVTGDTQEAPRFERVYMVGHAHLDPVWLWRWTEGYQEGRAMVHAAVKLIGENDAYVFTLEQMAVLDWIRESDPALFQRTKELVAEGRIAMVGGWWVEPDCNLPCLEAFVRQGLVGQRFLMEHFGGIAGVGLNADPFGHTAALPQILRGHRLAGYCFLRPGPHETPMAETAFTWVGHDGTSIPAYRIPHEYCSSGAAIDNHVDAAISKIAPSVTGEAMVFYGVGNHGGGPTRRNLESLAEIDASGRHGRLEPAGPARFFASIARRGVDLPVWKGELQRHAAGCYAAHSGIKRLNLQAENALLEAERYATLAARADSMDDAALDDAWKAVLFNQFHDILPGSSIEIAYEDSAHQLGGAIAAGHRVTNRALQIRAGRIGIPLDEATQPILVFNPHPFPVTAPVEIEAAFRAGPWTLRTEDGEAVTFQEIRKDAQVWDHDTLRGLFHRRLRFVADLPAFGHALFRLHAQEAHETATATATAEGHVLRNDHLEVEIDPATGWVARCVRLSDGRDFAPPAGKPRTVVIDDESDTWGHRVESYVRPGESFRVESVAIEEAGPVSAAIRVTSRHGASRLSEVFRLHAGVPHLEIRVEVDWREHGKLMKLRFPSSIRTDTARYAIQNGFVDRPADGMEYPGQRVVSVTDASTGAGLAVINDAKYAYDCVDGDIGITAVRSPVYAWHDPRELQPGTHYSYHDQGIQRFTCLVQPLGAESPDPLRLADTLTMPPRVMLESFHDGDLPASVANISGLDEAPDVAITAIKPWEDDRSATVIRLANHADDRRSVDLALHFLAGRRLATELAAFQVATFVIPVEGEPFEVDLIELTPDTDVPVLSRDV